METLSSSTSITLDRMVLVVFNSVGRRDVPLVSVATTSLVVSDALPSKISAVVLFPENISSAYKIVFHKTIISTLQQGHFVHTQISSNKLVCVSI